MLLSLRGRSTNHFPRQTESILFQDLYFKNGISFSDCRI